MRVDRYILCRHLRADRRLPDPSPLQEHPLQCGVLLIVGGTIGIDQSFDSHLWRRVEIQALVRQVAAQGNDRDTQSAQVTNVLAKGEFAVDLVASFATLLQPSRHQPIELLHELVGQLRERRAVFLRPPGLQVSIAIELGTLVVEAMPDLVANDGADRSEIPGRVGVHIEKRWAQDRSGEGDVIHHRVVERVDGLWGGEPRLRIRRLAQLR